jgi:hypothetical protein
MKARAERAQAELLQGAAGANRRKSGLSQGAAVPDPAARPRTATRSAPNSAASPSVLRPGRPRRTDLRPPYRRRTSRTHRGAWRLITPRLAIPASRDRDAPGHLRSHHVDARRRWSASRNPARRLLGSPARAAIADEAGLSLLSAIGCSGISCCLASALRGHVVSWRPASRSAAAAGRTGRPGWRGGGSRFVLFFFNEILSAVGSAECAAPYAAALGLARAGDARRLDPAGVHRRWLDAHVGPESAPPTSRNPDAPWTAARTRPAALLYGAAAFAMLAGMGGGEPNAQSQADRRTLLGRRRDGLSAV